MYIRNLENIFWNIIMDFVKKKNVIVLCNEEQNYNINKYIFFQKYM